MHTTPLSAYDEVREALEKFQEGYRLRRVEEIDSFMELFLPEADIELIGTGGVEPGEDEWCLNRKTVRTLIEDDWNYWGDVVIDTARAHMKIHGDVAWLSAPGTVNRQLNANQSIQNYLDSIKGVIGRDMTSEEKLLEILRGGSNTLYEAQQGTVYIWPFRFTAVLVRSAGSWRFSQTQFSFPTTRFPDVRLKRPKEA